MKDFEEDEQCYFNFISEPKFTEMKQQDIIKLKEKIWLKNGKRCPVLDKEIPLDKAVLDHAHKRNDEPYAPDKGTIRTSLDFRVNAVLGKLENAVKRTGLHKEEDFDMVEFCRNAADYFDKGAYMEGDCYFIHPSEVPKRERVGKREYNKVRKYYFKIYPNRKRPPKKPTYVNDNWKQLVKKVDEYIKGEHNGKKKTRTKN